jgi:hypothetical protein
MNIQVKVSRQGSTYAHASMLGIENKRIKIRKMGENTVRKLK